MKLNIYDLSRTYILINREIISFSFTIFISNEIAIKTANERINPKYQLLTNVLKTKTISIEDNVKTKKEITPFRFNFIAKVLHDRSICKLATIS